MKKFISLTVSLVMIFSSIFFIGCSSSKDKKLVECLELTKNADSVEVNVTTKSKIKGQEIDMEMKINMQVEDLKKDMKAKFTMELLKEKSEFFMSIKDDKAIVYVKDRSGKYTVDTIDSKQLNEMDIMKSFNSYIDIINGNPDMLTKKSDNIFELNVPKEKVEEFYSKITSKNSNYKFDKLKVEFTIGEDGYLQKAKISVGNGEVEIEGDTNYSNYNKKFDLSLPSVGV